MTVKQHNKRHNASSAHTRNASTPHVEPTAHPHTAPAPTPPPPTSAESEPASCAKVAAGSADKGILFLRLFIGTLLFTQAITKSQQYPWLEQEYPSMWGLSSASVVSIVGIIEAVAGALLAMGLLTRITSAVMTVIMFGAAFMLFPSQTFDQAELKVVYAGIYIFLLIAGAGRYSLDRLICTLKGPRGEV